MFFMPFETVRRLRAKKFVYTLSATIPAFNGPQAGALEVTALIQDGFHFWSEVMTISFSTLNSAGVDDGVNRLTCQFRDNANQLGLSNTFVDLSTLAAPGRQRSNGVAGDPSGQLQTVGIPWPHLYAATGAVACDVRNSSNTANTFRATFNGYLIPISALSDFDAWAAGAMDPAVIGA